MRGGPQRGYFDARYPAVTPPTPLLDQLYPEDCFRFPYCPALVCPMDSDWKRRVHYTGKAVCTLLCESVKPSAGVFFQTYFADSDKLLAEIKAVLPVMVKQHPIIRLALHQATQVETKYEEGKTHADDR